MSECGAGRAGFQLFEWIGDVGGVVSMNKYMASCETYLTAETLFSCSFVEKVDAILKVTRSLCRFERFVWSSIIDGFVPIVLCRFSQPSFLGGDTDTKPLVLIRCKYLQSWCISPWICLFAIYHLSLVLNQHVSLSHPSVAYPHTPLDLIIERATARANRGEL